MASLPGVGISIAARPLSSRQSQVVAGISGLKVAFSSGQRKSFLSVKWQQSPMRICVSCSNDQCLRTNKCREGTLLEWISRSYNRKIEAVQLKSS